MARYLVRGPANAAANGELYSTKTENVNLSAANWSASADGPDPAAYRCPRAFIPYADGDLVFQAAEDSADVTLKVVKGVPYAIALKSVTQASCGAALQITNALLLLY